MIRRFSAIAIAVALLFCLFTAQADTYPIRRGAVNDDAAVLSDSTSKDIETLNERSDAQFTVITRHFLGGADAQEYCDALFQAWNLSSNDLLLLLVIGEERYAVSMGDVLQLSALSPEQLNSLLSAKIRQPFIQERDYDGAVGGFLLAAATQIARAYGDTLNTSGLFGTTHQEQQNASGASAQSGSWFSSWNSTGWGNFFSDNDLNLYGQNQGDISYEYDEDNGFSMGRLIFIGIVLLFIIRSRRRKGKSGLGAAGWGAAAMGAKEVLRGMDGRHGTGPRRR